MFQNCGDGRNRDQRGSRQSSEELMGKKVKGKIRRESVKCALIGPGCSPVNDQNTAEKKSI